MVKATHQVRGELPEEAVCWGKKKNPEKNRLNEKSLWFLAGKIQQRLVVVSTYQWREKRAGSGRCFHPADKAR